MKRRPAHVWKGSCLDSPNLINSVYFEISSRGKHTLIKIRSEFTQAFPRKRQSYKSNSFQEGRNRAAANWTCPLWIVLWKKQGLEQSISDSAEWRKRWHILILFIILLLICFSFRIFFYLPEPNDICAFSLNFYICFKTPENRLEVERDDVS